MGVWPAPPPGSARILVCDDEPGVREGCRKILAAEGYEVVTAGDGAAVITKTRVGSTPVPSSSAACTALARACASASTALNQAAAMVTARLYDIVLDVGVEKLYHPDKRKSFAAFSGAVDVEIVGALLPEGALLDDAALVRLCGALRRQAQRAARFRCGECGFSSSGFFWQCPGCKSWDSLKPRSPSDLAGQVGARGG